MKPQFVLLAFLTSCQFIFAASATFVPVADTTISPEGKALADGISVTMIVGRLNPLTEDVPVRGLLRFDLSSLPSGAVVTSATVQVRMTAASDPSAHTHLLHRVTRAWTEPGANWDQADGVAFWDNAGGDYETAADASLPMSGPAAYLFSSSAGLVNTVQFWATNAAANFGWILRSAAEDAGRNARRFATREATTPADRPQLVVGYFVPPPPVTLANPRVQAGSFRFEFTAQPGASYTVESRPLVDSGAWTTVSTHSAPGVPTVIPVSHALTPSNRFYRVVSP
jgi:hypothetical protein